MADDALIAAVTGPDGRVTEVRGTTWNHVLVGHPEMADIRVT